MTEPYITVNKLAEYVAASATRRKQIIKNLKEDKDFIKIYYSEVKNFMPGFFRSGYDDNRIDTLIQKIDRKKVTTEWDEKDNLNSILVLKCLKGNWLPDLSELEIITAPEKLDHIRLGGLKVIIKPEVYLRHRKSSKIGAIKVHIAKTKINQLDSAGLQYVSTIIKLGFGALGYLDADIDRQACISLDVFQKRFDIAPTAYKRTVGLLEAACEEIVARWVSI